MEVRPPGLPTLDKIGLVAQWYVAWSVWYFQCRIPSFHSPRPGFHVPIPPSAPLTPLFLFFFGIGTVYVA